MSFKIASAILRGQWLIEPQYVQSNLPLIAGMITGQKADFGLTEKQLDEKSTDNAPVLFGAVMETRAYTVSYYTNFEIIPEGSIAVVPLYGPVLKYGDMCSYGMIDKAAILNRIQASGKFKSVVMDVDSPGGQASGTQLLADTILSLRESGIPVYAVVNDGMMASAAMWIGSACTAIYATTSTDMFGSIGVYTTLLDFTAYLEKMGVPVHEIYADPSTDKNKGYRDAMKSDYKAIKQDINFLAEAFISAVTVNRGDRLDTSKYDPFTGKMFKAEIALEIGLIDGIKSFSEVLGIAAAAGEHSQVNSKSNTNMFNKFPKLAAFKGVAVASITQDQLNAVNIEISEAGIDGVTLALDSEIQSGQTAIGKVANLETSGTANKTKITEQETKITALETKITELEGTVAAQKVKLGAPAEDPETPVNKKEDETLGSKDKKDQYLTSVDIEAMSYQED